MSELLDYPPQPPVFNYLLLKLASRCNLNCSYCYWFRDQTVYNKPPVLTPDAEAAFLTKLSSHINRHNLKYFHILFHGGEPLLFRKTRFSNLCTRLRELEVAHNIRLELAITSNGVLIDTEWARLFQKFGVRVTVSIDGPDFIHDRNRVDFAGAGTLSKTLRALHLLRAEGIEPGVLAVCDPAVDPQVVCTFLINELRVQAFDILVPDANHADHPPSIANYYVKLFDLWYDDYLNQHVKIRFLQTATKGVLTIPSRSESIGYRPVSTMTVLTDGSLEPLDVLRTAGDGATQTAFNIFDHQLQDLQADPLWREVWNASLNLAEECEECCYRRSCGGGHIASRWSDENRYDNPSVYCADMKTIFGHISSRLRDDLSQDETVDNVVRVLNS